MCAEGHVSSGQISNGAASAKTEYRKLFQPASPAHSGFARRRGGALISRSPQSKSAGPRTRMSAYLPKSRANSAPACITEYCHHITLLQAGAEFALDLGRYADILVREIGRAHV